MNFSHVSCDFYACHIISADVFSCKAIKPVLFHFLQSRTCHKEISKLQNTYESENKRRELFIFYRNGF